MTINEIYDKYNIMPNLRLHMLRVAAVASLVCESLESSVNKNNIIKACLLHDMGNIIKFKLDLYPETTVPEGLEYWENIKRDFINKYGNNEHEATKQIVKELGLVQIIELVDAVGFSNAKINLESGNLSKMIVCYADQSVAPNRILSL